MRGFQPDFVAFDRPWPRRKLELPTYPFQRQRYWVKTPMLAPSAATRRSVLGVKYELASGETVYHSGLSSRSNPGWPAVACFSSGGYSEPCLLAWH